VAAFTFTPLIDKQMTPFMACRQKSTKPAFTSDLFINCILCADPFTISVLMLIDFAFEVV